MARCTAPSEGHRSANAAANCPACRGSSRYGGYRSYSSGYGSYPSYSPATSSSSVGSSGGSGRVRAKWSKVGSTILYTPTEVRALTPIRETAENRAGLPDLLEARGVSVWFSEKDVALGTSLLREIDRGLVKSRVGIILVTPALLRRLPTAGVADKELSALLATEQLVPIVHNTTYEALRNVSPLLASRSGLSTGENSMAMVADKLAELVAT
ncbi:toll/interleukin-1 receptor domain-containing protein [Agrobacterium larrymoorei]|uniref:TIR domain-containing protein n=1 Tax=Agrobacterium larrymoorei TaxID=160699 RepID=A0A4D7E2N9_9HYPH|nr:toll/interleukin-1 receptor domain-containing protein [Agrobacterium larrymoorei]QCJ00553.1 TIR domain-containing protein [Agrobacterium larrymoorei]QYA10547.1 toll/interleukin-1 receptor domain-containing protein [Agrobacterium larrymoorei]